MPLPTFSDDDFLDFCVKEALFVREVQEQAKAQKRQEREEWKRQKPGGTGPPSGG
jgi:hypothetical protein